MDKNRISRDRNEALITKDLLDLYFTIDIEKGKIFNKISRSGVTMGKESGHTSILGYRNIRINSIAYCTHRLLYFYAYGKFPTLDIDHINGVKDDNRISNLREVSCRENHFNRHGSNKNKKGDDLPVGVSLCTDRKNKPFRSHLQVGDKQISKYFSTKEDAMQVRLEWAKKYHIITPVLA